VKGPVPAFSWVYIPDKRTGPFNRISFPSNYSTGVAPPGHSSILAEITFREDDEIDRMGEDRILSLVISSLMEMGIISHHDDIVHTWVERQKYAYVIYDLSYRKNIALIKDFCRSRDIGLVGRFSQFEYLNMDDCIRNAMEYAREHPCG